MSNVVDLRKYRAQTRKSYLSHHRGAIDNFLSNYIGTLSSIAKIQQHTQNALCAVYESENSWDYQSFRDLLFDALDTQISTLVYKELCLQPWFKKEIISKDYIIERCVSIIIEIPHSHILAEV